MMGNFGDRMREYERIEAARQFIPLLSVCARLDGKSFKRFTKDMERPYDRGLVDRNIRLILAGSENQFQQKMPSQP